ncbi:hypothetical protein KCTC52924_01939 [Arenibacter antarcticus]|uniref:Restriction endonuclease subunit S n=1 Tax=Arenibacter antarcticus TaxID=2040469 RepID=A0ABW5VE44_9FLAO|nr:restriction endonuclease subunit S [Arenibacter sp. H213]MCM4168369.1 hypothetical protein [Arenibacter sp. H213]
MKMLLKSLEEVADIVAGQSPPSKFYNKNGNGLPFFQGKTDFGDKYPMVRAWCTEPSKVASANDILMSVRAPVGPVNIATEKCVIGRGISAISAKSGYYSLYLYYYLKTNQNLIRKYSTGSTFKAITQKEIKRIPINIPESLNDQKRIAKILSNCEALIQKRTESIDLLDELLKSTFLEMFGDPRSNSKNWESGPVIAFADCIVPGRDKPKSFTGDTPWITTNDLNHLGTTTSSRQNIGLSPSEIKNVRARVIPNNSVLITCVGDLGVVSLAGGNMVVNQQLHTFQCKEDMIPTFLMFTLSFQKQYMYKMASKTTVPYMNKTTCNGIPIIKPSKDLQEDFVTIYEKVNSIKTQFISSLHELKNLYCSLSQRAFKGELNLSKVDISDMEDSKKKVDPEIEDGRIMSEEEHTAQHAQINKIISSEIENESYLTENVISYINDSKELRDVIYEKVNNKNLDLESLKKSLSKVNNLGEKIAVEVIEFTPWQIEQHRSIERYISLLPENILDEFPNINQFSRNNFDYGSMSLDDYYGIPHEVIAQYGSIESHTMDLDFFFRKYFSNKFFTMKDVQDIYDKVVYDKGGWFKYEDMKEYIFKSLEGEDALLTQEFVEIEKTNPALGKKEVSKEVMLKVLP